MQWEFFDRKFSPKYSDHASHKFIRLRSIHYPGARQIVFQWDHKFKKYTHHQNKVNNIMLGCI